MMRTIKYILGLTLILTISFSCSKEEKEGCTDPFATNFNGDAVKDDGSCIYSEDIRGCMNPLADNYNPEATIDDGSCIISGCTDPNSDNYNPEATVDDGSCIDPREKFAGTWEVTSDCGFQLSLAQEQTITYDSLANNDSVFIQPFLAFGTDPVSAFVSGTTITLPEQQAGGGFITFSAVGTINEEQDEIELQITYSNFLGSNECTATYSRL